VVGPNNDPGHQGILRAYREAAEEVEMEMSVPQEIFWAALDGSGLLVGNSSAGIIESATFGCAVLNIGERQAGRERSDNVIDVPWNSGEIDRALRRALTDKAFLRRVARRRNVYGDGRASARIVRILESLHDSALPLTTIKRFHDA
jgi:UDP-N-acetylglucosamine 2-epimerase